MDVRSTHLVTTLLLALSLLSCKRESAKRAGGDVPTWYRAVVRAPDGVEAVFFLGVPPEGEPGHAVFKVGSHEVRTDATFDGTTLKVPLAVHQTSVDATVAPDGSLNGTFSTTWRAWGASSLPLTATKVTTPAAKDLGTVTGTGPALDLGEARTVWRITMSETGTVKLVVHQTAPGQLEAMMFFDTGNISYVAGNAVGDQAVLTGFDGTAGYRLELALAADHKSATGRFFGDHRLAWRESLTAERVPDFELALQPKAAEPGGKVGLPKLPELASLPSGPLLVELGGSWCSTCRNAAPFLAQLHRDYHPRGLQMLTLLYEFDDDRRIDLVQVEEYKKTYGATWPVVTVPGTTDDLAEIMPTGVVNMNPAGFPILLFLAPDRSLVALHAGFPAADQPEEFHRVDTEIRANIERLLATPAPPTP